MTMPNRRPIIKVLCCLLAFFLLGCQSTQETAEEETPHTYGMWFAYLDYQNLDVSSEETFRQEIETACTNMEELGITTVYVHASAYTDSLYNGTIYPRSTIFAETDYDPLGIFVEIAHAHDLKIEAWVNPYRSVAVGEESFFSEDHVIRQWIERNDERVRQVNGRWYLNPAYEEVRVLIEHVVQELLDSYDIDGIHFDDYFYPEGIDDSFDAYIYAQNGESQGLSLETFRQNQTAQLIAEVHDLTQAAGKTFSVSVAGNNDNNLTMYYADVSAWLQAGDVDVLIPQIYWGYNHPLKPYTETLQEFYDLAQGTGTTVLAGIAAYKVGTTDAGAGDAADEWVQNSDMLQRQTQTALEMGCAGAVYFRYSHLFLPAAEVQAAANAERTNLYTYLLQNP